MSDEDTPGVEAYAVVALLIVVVWVILGGLLAVAWNALPAPDISWGQGVCVNAVIFIAASVWSLGQRTP